MADVSADLKNWSNTASNNNPSGTTTVGTGLDDNLRQIQATVKQDLAHIGANIASATTTDLGAIAGLFHTITGTTTITSFGTVSAGIWKILQFSSSLTITHNSTSLKCPNGVSLQTRIGQGYLCQSLGSGNWKIYPFTHRDVYHALDFGAIGDGATDDTTSLQNAINITKALGAILNLGDSQFTYKITTALTGGSNLHIRSSGATIDMSAIASGEKTAIVCAGSLGTGVAITGGSTENSFTITLANTSSFAVDDYVQVASSDNYTYGGGSYDVTKGEIHRIRSIVANTSITFTTPLVDTYSTTPKVYPVTWVENVSIKGVKFDGLDTPATGQRGVALRYVKNFDVSENEFTAQDYYQVECSSSIIGNITKNKFTGVYYDGVTGTTFYGICVMNCSQWVEVGGNIGNKVRHLVITTANTSGNGHNGQPYFINIHNNMSYDSMAGAAGRSYAYESHGFGRFNSWVNNQAHGCYSGFCIDGGEDIDFKGNKIVGYAYQAIIIGKSDANLKNIHISGNSIDNYTEEVTSGSPAAIRLEGSLTITNVVIEGNAITKAAKSNVGIAFSLAGGSVAMRNVRIKNNTASAGDSESTGTATGTTSTFIGDFEGNDFYGWRGGYSVTNGAVVRIEGGSVCNFSAGATGYGVYTNSDRSIFKNIHFKNIHTPIRCDTSSTNCLATLNTMTGCTVTTPSDAGAGNTTSGNYVV